jgi:ribosomal protein S18 acetylase RimI-like enzyme
VTLGIPIADDLVIRSVGVAEAEEILDLYRQCEDFLSLGPSPAATCEMVLEDLRHSARELGVYSGVFEADRLIGVVDWIDPPYGGDAKKGFISLLMIAQGCRGRGIGSRVLEFVEGRMREKLASTVETAVQVNNEPAIRFWQRHGYEVAGGPIANPDGTTVHSLRKGIDASSRKPR